jgi:hypothetical protein
MSFGEGDNGETYFVTQEGGIHKFESANTAAGQ